MADGRDNQVACDVECFAVLIGHRRAVLDPACAHAQRHRPPGVFTVAEHHLHRHHAVLDVHAFAQRVLDFVFGGGHLRAREQRGEGHLRAFAARRAGRIVRDKTADDGFRARRAGADVAEAARHRHHIDGGVAAADAHHARAGRLQSAAVEGVEKIHAADAVRRIAAGHRQCAPGLAAEGPQHRVEFALEVGDGGAGGGAVTGAGTVTGTIAGTVTGTVTVAGTVTVTVTVTVTIAADPGIHPQFNPAEVQDARDFAVENRARRAVVGDAVAHHAAGFGARVEQHAGVAAPPQLAGRGQAGRARADNRHALLAERRIACQCVVFRGRVVADELLDRVDADKIVDFIAVASGLARRRADPAHHRRKRVGGGDALERVFAPVHLRGLGRRRCFCRRIRRRRPRGRRRLLDAAHDLQPAAHIFAGRATGLARRRAVHIHRAFVRRVLVKNCVAPTRPLMRAVLVSAQGERGLRFGLGFVRHVNALRGRGLMRRRPTGAN